MHAVTTALMAFWIAATPLHAQPIELIVTGKPMVVNGQAVVPRGIFGVHEARWDVKRSAEMGVECYRGTHFEPSANSKHLDKRGRRTELSNHVPMVIDCQGERYMHPRVLEDKNYAAHFKRIGRQYGQATRKAGVDAYVEFWNEPYLNWASRSHDGRGSAYQAKWYETNGRTDGGRVTIKGWSKPLDHLRWKKHWPKGEDGQVYYGVPIPDGLNLGDTFEAASTWYWTNRSKQTFTVVEHWSVHDPTARHWWSGQQNLQFYRWMLRPFAEALKQANPDAKLIAGWGFAYGRGDWDVFTRLYQPLIDAHIDQIDGLSEHHYNANTRRVNGWYEVATGYAMTRHGKWLTNYNTQAYGLRHPPTDVQGDEYHAAHKHLAAATYVLREVLELLHRSPAKVASRAAHQPGPGEWAAFRLLRQLRGPLVQTAGGDDDLWSVAAINGDKLVVAMFNNGDEREVALTVTPPAGRGVTYLACSSLAIDRDTRELVIRTDDRIAGDLTRPRRTLPPQAALVLTYTLDGKPDAGPIVSRTQHFARQGVLVDVEANQSATFDIDVPREKIESAKLRLVLELHHDGVTAELNGQALDVVGRDWTGDTVVPVDRLSRASKANKLTIHAGRKPVRVCAASIIVDGPTD